MQSNTPQSKCLTPNLKLWVIATLLLPCFVFLLNNIKIAVDNQPIRCLPERVYFINNFVKPKRLDYVYFSSDAMRKASSKNDYLSAHSKIIKQLVGIPGDRLLINRRGVFINDQLLSTDLSIARLLYQKEASDFYKDEIIPADSYFVFGTHPLSNDSRFWGYLPISDVLGKATGLL